MCEEVVLSCSEFHCIGAAEVAMSDWSDTGVGPVEHLNFFCQIYIYILARRTPCKYILGCELTLGGVVLKQQLTVDDNGDNDDDDNNNGE